MPRSHFERLIWNFIKNYFLAGFFLFLTPTLIPLTVTVMVFIISVYYGFVSSFTAIIIGLGLILVGLLASKKNFSVRVSIAIVVLLAILGLLDYLEILPVFEPFISLIGLDFLHLTYIALITAWLIFNVVYFIIETAEFFSSTTGLLVLWGSDEKHIFLSPLPQLISMIALIYLTYSLLIGRITLMEAAIFYSTISSLFVFVYVVFRNNGRIVRSTYAILMILASYVISASLYNLNTSQAATLNIILTLISILFMMQSRIRVLAKIGDPSKGGSIKPPIAVLMVYGTILAISPVILNINTGGINALNLIWELNTFAILLGSIIVGLYWVRSGKLDWYVGRDKISTKDLLIETSFILGSKFLEELLKFTKTEMEQAVKKASETASDLAKKVGDTIDKIKEEFSKFFKR